MTKKVFNLNNMIPHSVRLVDPKEAHFQKGSCTFKMPTSYDGTLLDHQAKHMVYFLMLATAANVVVVVVVVSAVIVTVVMVLVAVVALAFVLCHPLPFLPHRLVVACCFASIAGIFAAHPSFG
jgi:hypothetical protein